MAKRIAYLGPRGTYTEDATERYDPTAERYPCSTISATADAVRSGEADEGVAPIENSLEGAVNDTLDLLIRETTLLVRQEILVPIRHCLLVKPGTRGRDIQVVYSIRRRSASADVTWKRRSQRRGWRRHCQLRHRSSRC